MPWFRGPGGLAGELALALSLAGAAHAGQDARAGQDDARPARPEVDPYTRGDPAAMKRAGYVSFGPFRLGDDETTDSVRILLAGEPILWVETEHFRIGSSLEEVRPQAERFEQKKLADELERLEARIGGLRTKPKKLDPWLRLHLFALRLEEQYAAFLATFGLKEADFPPATSATSPTGRYLGMRDKFVVLLLEKKSALSRYTAHLCGTGWENALRFCFPKTGALFLGLSNEGLDENLRGDLSLHDALVYLITDNLLAAFEGYDYDVPAWWRTGVARWFARRVDPRCLLFTASEAESLREEKDADWEPKVRARVSHEYFPTTEEMFGWRDPDGWEFARHMMAWSRADYLLRGDVARARAVLIAFEGAADRHPDATAAARTQEGFSAAFQAAAGAAPAEFDRAWAAWVLATYARK